MYYFTKPSLRYRPRALFLTCKVLSGGSFSPHRQWPHHALPAVEKGPPARPFVLFLRRGSRIGGINCAR